MEYIYNGKEVVLNFSETFCKTEIEILDSNCFKEIWTSFIDRAYKTSNQKMLQIFNIFPKKHLVSGTINLFKGLLVYSIETLKGQNSYFFRALDKKDVLYDVIQDFYDYWRRLERYAITSNKANYQSVESASFIAAQTEFTDTVLKTYRAISEKLFGSHFSVYRQLPSGINASILISKNAWMNVDSKYAFLSKCPFIEQILIRPPLISYTRKNKRTGVYPETYNNPIDEFKNKFNPNDYYCFAAMVGSSLTYIYFHVDYMALGIANCNLFEFVPLNKVKGKKPDAIYVFGAEIDGESKFYYDEEEDIYFGVAPHDESIEYFGYMKKMLLTLYNVKMIKQGALPLHGACVHITMKNGKEKNIVLIGDSGAGKSETIAALQEYAGDNISSILTVFDDMGTFKYCEDGKIRAYGTEIGAFVRIDDMARDYISNEMDRAIFMNPDKSNSRLIIPVATYPQIMAGYEVDMLFYANNYSEENVEIEIFDDLEKAKAEFKRGARVAKGTTQEKGLVESFFANPFGPVQKKEETTKIIDKMFKDLKKSGVEIGVLHTKLAVDGMEHDGPMLAAKKLFEILDK